MSFLELSNVSKSFGTKKVVNNISFEINKGELVTLLGPSGCGKTTTLRMIAGFEQADAGQIILDGQDITHLPADKRGLGMVFQAYALFPNMTVLDNVGFGLKMKGLPVREIREKAIKILSVVGLAEYVDRYPHQLSGGQQQRVALARALVREPALLLLDEPLSAIDAKVRIALRELIKTLQRELHITTIYVTHDQEEALALSDRIAVMENGEIVQFSPPEEIYFKPLNRFVASFVGTLNIFKIEVVNNQEGIGLLGGQKVKFNCLKGKPREVTAAVRPEHIQLFSAAASAAAENILSGKLSLRTFLGAIDRVKVTVGEEVFLIDLLNSAAFGNLNAGDELRFTFEEKDLILF